MEVYNGDVIKDKWDRIMEVHYCHAHCRLEFVSISGCDFKSAALFEWFQDGEIDGEVIGNIHQNPELLEV